MLREMRRDKKNTAPKESTHLETRAVTKGCSCGPSAEPVTTRVSERGRVGGV